MNFPDDQEFPDDLYLRHASHSLQLVVDNDQMFMRTRLLARVYQRAFIETDDLDWDSLEHWRDPELYRLLQFSIPWFEQHLRPSFRFETQTMLMHLDHWLSFLQRTEQSDQQPGSERDGQDNERQ